MEVDDDSRKKLVEVALHLFTDREQELAPDRLEDIDDYDRVFFAELNAFRQALRDYGAKNSSDIEQVIKMEKENHDGSERFDRFALAILWKEIAREMQKGKWGPKKFMRIVKIIERWENRFPDIVMDVEGPFRGWLKTFRVNGERKVQLSGYFKDMSEAEAEKYFKEALDINQVPDLADTWNDNGFYWAVRMPIDLLGLALFARNERWPNGKVHQHFTPKRNFLRHTPLAGMAYTGIPEEWSGKAEFRWVPLFMREDGGRRLTKFLRM